MEFSTADQHDLAEGRPCLGQWCVFVQCWIWIHDQREGSHKARLQWHSCGCWFCLWHKLTIILICRSQQTHLARYRYKSKSEGTEKTLLTEPEPQGKAKDWRQEEPLANPHQKNGFMETWLHLKTFHSFNTGEYCLNVWGQKKRNVWSQQRRCCWHWDFHAMDLAVLQQR